MHVRNYVSEIEQIYDELISNITTQQNSLEDLAFWAKTYGIDEDENVLVPLPNVELQTTTNNINNELWIAIAPITTKGSPVDDGDEEQESQDKE
ncbi:unnamed protein product [Rotaria sp. Silwood1]|nr:unnamed protein product [Rotaria sp. Silwood1]